MRRTRALVLVVALAWAQGEVSPAAAQVPGTGQSFAPAYSRPRVSPYLNLLRGGASPQGNFVTLVRPELQAQQSFNQLRFQTNQNQQSIVGLQQGVAGPGVFATGHQVGFQTQGSYFQSFGGPGGGAGFTIGGLGGAAGGQGFQGNINRGGGGGGGALPPSRGGRGGR